MANVYPKGNLSTLSSGTTMKSRPASPRHTHDKPNQAFTRPMKPVEHNRMLIAYEIAYDVPLHKAQILLEIDHPDF